MKNKCAWVKEEVSAELVKDIDARYGCGLLAASILARRLRMTDAVSAAPQVQFYLEEDRRYLHNPFLMSGMEDAVERILAAIPEEGTDDAEKEKILIFGDRDVDGITSTALLSSYLRSLGCDVSWRIPMHDDPYGLSMAAIDDFYAENGSLVITVDCGVSNVAEIAHANELGIDVVVTDHHNPQNEIPDAIAIVNPKTRGSDGQSTYPFTELAGCGVAYKLYLALHFAQLSQLYNQNICFLNIYPANDAYIIEILKTRNLVVTSRLCETVSPGAISIGDTRISAFLEGQQIFCWDGALQKRLFEAAFGKGVELNMLDVAPEVAKEISGVSGENGAPLSLLRLREVSRLARYSAKPPAEIDVFFNLFVSFVLKREKFFQKEDLQYLQLAAIGTISDLMPLVDENRLLVRAGLAAIEAKARPGVADLLQKLNISGRKIVTSDISWHLSPVINSAGRMGHPEKAVELFLDENFAKREEAAREIIEYNNCRKSKLAELQPRARKDAEKNLSRFDGRLALCYGTDYPRGFTGLIANDLIKTFNIPALVVSFVPNGEGGVATGSFRSVRGYALTSILEQLQEYFTDKGGHDFAAGFSLPLEKWPAFLEALTASAASIELEAEAACDTLTIDAETPPAFMTTNLMEIIDRFEPYGRENEELTLLSRGLSVNNIEVKGKTDSKHLKMTFGTGKNLWPAMYWNGAQHIDSDLRDGARCDIVYRLHRDYYRGRETPQLVILDMKTNESPS